MNLREQVQHYLTVFNDSVVQPLWEFVLRYWEQDDKIALYVATALAIGYIVGRLRAFHRFQNRGELRVSKAIMREFRPPDYHLMNHITLEMEDGSTQIDHILVSRFGVFVIETKDYRGWIFGGMQHYNWTQVIFRRKFKFRNPIHQNKRHVRAIRELLDFLPIEAIESIVVFTGDAEFKTEVPWGVYDIPGLMNYLRGRTTEVMSLNRVQFCVGRLETRRLGISSKTDVEHVESLNRRHGRRG